MAAVRILAIRRQDRPRVAYYQQGSGNLDLKALQRRLKQYVRQQGVPHHFKVQVVVGSRPDLQDRLYDPAGRLLAPRLERNSLRLYASVPLPGRHRRDTTIGFPTALPHVAWKLTITPQGRVHSSTILVTQAVPA